MTPWRGGLPFLADRRALVLLVTILIGGSGCDQGLRWLLAVEEIAPEGLREELARPRPPRVVDLRPREAYERGHIPGALHLLPAELSGYFSRGIPDRTRPVVTVCHQGTLSLVSAAVLQGLGYRGRSLRGGMEGWRERRYPLARGAGPPIAAHLLLPPRRAASRLSQQLTVVAAFGFKPLAMLISLGIILWLWRRREADLTLLWRAMVVFLLGESVCAASYLMGETDAMVLVHGLGMLVMGALLPWGLFRLLDGRVLQLTDPAAPCQLQPLCGPCWKREAVACGLQRLFLLLAPTLALVALLPLGAPLRRQDVVLSVLGTDRRWFKGLAAQILEFRLYPLLAALLFSLTFLRLLRGDHRALDGAQRPFFAGLGFLSYALLRFFLFTAFADNPLWSSFWEEATVLITVLGLLLLLWLFRRPLGLGRPIRPPGSGAAAS